MQLTLPCLIITDATAHLFELALKHEGLVAQDLAPVAAPPGAKTLAAF
jgi:hypothetical protein